MEQQPAGSEHRHDSYNLTNTGTAGGLVPKELLGKGDTGCSDVAAAAAAASHGSFQRSSSSANSRPGSDSAAALVLSGSSNTITVTSGGCSTDERGSGTPCHSPLASSTTTRLPSSAVGIQSLSSDQVKCAPVPVSNSTPDDPGTTATSTPPAPTSTTSAAGSPTRKRPPQHERPSRSQEEVPGLGELLQSSTTAVTSSTAAAPSARVAQVPVGWPSNVSRGAVPLGSSPPGAAPPAGASPPRLLLLPPNRAAGLAQGGGVTGPVPPPGPPSASSGQALLQGHTSGALSQASAAPEPPAARVFARTSSTEAGLAAAAAAADGQTLLGAPLLPTAGSGTDHRQGSAPALPALMHQPSAPAQLRTVSTGGSTAGGATTGAATPVVGSPAAPSSSFMTRVPRPPPLSLRAASQTAAGSGAPSPFFCYPGPALQGGPQSALSLQQLQLQQSLATPQQSVGSPSPSGVASTGLSPHASLSHTAGGGLSHTRGGSNSASRQLLPLLDPAWLQGGSASPLTPVPPPGSRPRSPPLLRMRTSLLLPSHASSEGPGSPGGVMLSPPSAYGEASQAGAGVPALGMPGVTSSGGGGGGGYPLQHQSIGGPTSMFASAAGQPPAQELGSAGASTTNASLPLPTVSSSVQLQQSAPRGSAVRAARQRRGSVDSSVSIAGGGAQGPGGLAGALGALSSLYSQLGIPIRSRRSMRDLSHGGPSAELVTVQSTHGSMTLSRQHPEGSNATRSTEQYRGDVVAPTQQYREHQQVRELLLMHSGASGITASAHSSTPNLDLMPMPRGGGGSAESLPRVGSSVGPGLNAGCLDTNQTQPLPWQPPVPLLVRASLSDVPAFAGIDGSMAGGTGGTTPPVPAGAGTVMGKTSSQPQVELSGPSSGVASSPFMVAMQLQQQLHQQSQQAGGGGKEGVLSHRASTHLLLPPVQTTLHSSGTSSTGGPLLPTAGYSMPVFGSSGGSYTHQHHHHCNNNNNNSSQDQGLGSLQQMSVASGLGGAPRQSSVTALRSRPLREMAASVSSLTLQFFSGGSPGKAREGGGEGRRGAGRQHE